MGKDNGGGSFAEMFESSMSTRSSVPVGERVEGTVVTIGREYVFLDLGVRADGLLPLEEVKVDGEVKVSQGDKITVIATGHRDGAVLCARRLGAGASNESRGDKDAALASIRDAYEAGMPVEGSVKETVKGGYSILLMGQRAFCPISQIEKGYCEEPEEHVGRTYSFAVIEFDGTGRNLVVSRRKLLEAEAAELAAEAWQTLNVGDVRDGTVSTIKSYGAFVDIGGVEGLLHVSEISHERIDDPADVLSKGQQISVSIKDMDHEKQRLSLSLKALAEDPWLAAQREVKVGAVTKGKVIRLARFGAFVEISKGVEGLVHISEMVQDRRINTPREVVKEGEEVQVRVLSVEPEKHRVSLSMIVDGDDDAKALAEHRAARPVATGLGTLGDLLGAKLKKQ